MSIDSFYHLYSCINCTYNAIVYARPDGGQTKRRNKMETNESRYEKKSFSEWSDGVHRRAGVLFWKHSLFGGVADILSDNPAYAENLGPKDLRAAFEELASMVNVIE